MNMITVAAWTGSICLLFVAVMYVLCIGGYPCGEYLLGGKNKRIGWKGRLICIACLMLQLIAITVILQAANLLPLVFSLDTTRMVCRVIAVFLVLNVAMNLLSSSRKEKLVMVPLAAIAAACFCIVALKGICFQ